MYQTAPHVSLQYGADPFLTACTSTAPTRDNVAHVRSLASLLRLALDAGDLNPLQQYVAALRDRCADLADLIAAAQYEVTETLMQLPVRKLHDAVRHLANIVRQITPVAPFSLHSQEFAARLSAV